jgi:hypothetical protein
MAAVERNPVCMVGLKSVLEIWIWIRLDPDLFGAIQILERAMAVHGAIFSALKN